LCYKTTKEVLEQKDSLIHQTDYEFQKFCQTVYGINRGVYNVIDKWFYEQGFDNFYMRREAIIYFLIFVNNNFGKELCTKIKFGKGGVKEMLYLYLDRNINKSLTS